MIMSIIQEEILSITPQPGKRDVENVYANYNGIAEPGTSSDWKVTISNQKNPL